MSRPDPPLIALATGGTGGHVFPARALAETMLDRNWRVVMFVDRRGLRYLDNMPDAVCVHTIPSATHAGKGLGGLVTVPFRILSGLFAAMVMLLRDRPAVQVGFGGYTTFPPVLAGWLLRIPSLLHEQNAQLGLANRVLVRLTRRLATATENPDVPQGVTAVRTGTPVRAAIRRCSDVAYTPPAPVRNRILIMAGSQGAAFFDSVVPEAIAQIESGLCRTLVLTQQFRAGAADRLLRRYTSLGVTADIQPFIHDIPEQLAACQLVIARAGASSLAEICAIGRPAILVPLAQSAGHHQIANARSLEAAGAAICLEESEASPERLAGAMTSFLADADGAARMADAARSLAVTDAADALARTVIEIAGK
ncbi:MAG: undecaprenyldiphospho-muramoylpentapeptide beta-N-acetylglucosaminyltransferase [Rhodobacteraceae bacterium]|nr:undecaprenyldiphospho-muramoylpentapeptide beta-N-acetylglucosaminyltransferase [Paracoccaceae bacterium]